MLDGGIELPYNTHIETTTPRKNMNIDLQIKAIQVKNRVHELCERAEKIFNITMPEVAVKFDLKGAPAGRARRHLGRYEVSFNAHLMSSDGWDHVFNNTVPHEVAHIVCFVTGWDSGHGRNWRTVCRALGGNAERCHREQVVYARGRTFVYTTTTGHKVSVSETIHKRIQAGQVREGRGIGMVHKYCAYEMIN